MSAGEGGRPVTAGIAGAGLLAVLTLLLGPQRSGRSQDAAAPPAGAGGPAPRATARAAEPRAAEFSGGSRLLAEFFGAPYALPASPDAVPPFATPALDLDVVVATLPDPFDSHLDFRYDTQLEAIQLAFGDAGFLLDRYWLPQRGDSLRVFDGRDSVRIAAHERYPGVVLFRRAGGGSPVLRLLYVVLEMPTGGVHKDALVSALRERERLLVPVRGAAPCDGAATPCGVRNDTIRVLGPTFSGTTPSVARAVGEWLATRPGTEATFVSGTATRFDDAPAAAGAGAARIRFRTTINPDALLDSALRCKVLPTLGLRRSQVLLLVESSTAYGQAFGTGGADRAGAPPAAAPCDTAHPTLGARDASEFHRVRFPMAISSLREEYARHPEAPEPATPLAGTRAQARIPITLTDPAQPKERPPVLSPLTPPALDLQLAEIARVVRDNRIRAVGLLASDVRDKLFVGEELRKRARDVQLFTYESELLYSRPDYAPALRGMLVFSTYPLIPSVQGWSSARPDWLVSSSDGALGTYNAVLALLGAPELMREYGAFAPGDGSAAGYPPVWLSVVGSGGLAPVSMIREYRDRERMIEGRSLAARVLWRPVSILYYATVLAVATAVAVLSRSTLGLLPLPLARWRRRPRPAAGPGAGASGSTAARPRAAPRRASPTMAFRVHRRESAPVPAATAEWTSWNIAQEFEGVEVASLRIHAWIYRGFLLVALLGILTPTVVLQLVATSPAVPFFLALSVVVFVGWLVAAGALAAALHLYLRTASRGIKFLKARPPVWPASRAALWLLEILTRWLVVVLGLVYAAAILRLALRLRGLREPDSSSFMLLYDRAIDLDSGVSPLVPITLGALGFVAWCAWHQMRIRLLMVKSPFEAVCLRRDARPLPAAPGGDARLTRRTWAAIASNVVGLRERLFLLVPDAFGVLLLLVAVLATGWLVQGFGRTVESVVLPSGRWPNAFEVLLRFSVVAMLAATVWGVYRLLALWLRLRACLDAVSELPLTTAFERLPPRVSRLTRLAFFSPPSRHVIATTTAALWGHLREIHRKRRPEFASELADAPLVERRIARLMRRRATDATEWQLEVWRLETLLSVLHALWREEPTSDEIDKVAKDLATYDSESARKAQPVAVSTSSQFRRVFTGSVGLWLRGAEEYAAVRVVEYAEWVLRHMRRLAGFVLLALLLMTAMLGSYPFQPQSRAKLALVVVLVVAVGVILLVLAQMNRNEVLSRVTKTDPGRITWSTAFVVNILLFAVVPLLALVSSEVPELRTLLFGWVEPLLRAVART